MMDCWILLLSGCVFVVVFVVSVHSVMSSCNKNPACMKMTKKTHWSGKWETVCLTNWFPCGPQEAYCRATFSFSGGLSSIWSLEHTEKPSHKPSNVSRVSRCKPSEVHHRLGLELCLKEILYSEKKLQDAEKENTENGTASCKSATRNCPYF